MFPARSPMIEDVGKQSATLLLLQLVQDITGYTKRYYRCTRRTKVVLLNPEHAEETHTKCGISLYSKSKDESEYRRSM